LISLRREATDGQKKKEACIDRTELLVIGLRSEQLILLPIGFRAVDVGALEVPAKFYSVTIEGFARLVPKIAYFWSRLEFVKVAP